MEGNGFDSGLNDMAFDFWHVGFVGKDDIAAEASESRAPAWHLLIHANAIKGGFAIDWRQCRIDEDRAINSAVIFLETLEKLRVRFQQNAAPSNFCGLESESGRPSNHHSRRPAKRRHLDPVYSRDQRYNQCLFAKSDRKLDQCDVPSLKSTGMVASCDGSFL